jgi:small subunit ribosomal protein S17
MAEDQTPQNVEETAAAPTTDAAPASRPHAEPQEVLPPKERRQRARAAKAAKTKTRSARTPEERHAERLTVRGKKAQERRAGRAKAKVKAAAAPKAQDSVAREHPPGTQKMRQGVVVSDKADKTITVRIDTSRRHRRYSKVVRTSQTVHAHDEANDAHTGDTVTVREARPLSRLKRWRLIEVLERAK